MGDERKPKRKQGSGQPTPLVPRVRRGQSTEASATPKATRSEELVAGHPRFSLRWADRAYDGSWSWCSDAEANELLHFMADMEELTWREIAAQQTGRNNRHRKHHDQPVGSICREATDRLGALGYDEIFGDTIYRFRLGSTIRLWGFVVDDVFYIVWWDRDHKVYPTEKD